MTNHYKIVCACGAVVSQCRCPGPGKSVTRVPSCKSCAARSQESADRRAPVQQGRRGHDRWPAGTIAWSEHEEAYVDYAKRFGTGQSAARLAERGGFGYEELIDHLGHEPRTWKVRE